MPTKRQHFVPRVYMKAWETEVETLKEPDKKFKGVYVFKNSDIGQGTSRESVLWKPHLYTINFKFSFICKSCPKVKKEFASKIYNLLRIESTNPVYGKIGYSIIKTKKSINKHFYELDAWDFYYENKNIAKKAAILNKIKGFNSYLLEEAFDSYLENEWENTCYEFIDAVHIGKPVGIGKSQRIISIEIAQKMISSFFIMLCRNPRFDAMGIYTNIKKNILYPFFSSTYNKDGNISKKRLGEGKEYANELMKGIWYSELYKMFFKSTGGFYHTIVQRALENFQMILFEAYDEAGNFITSDNPAFENKNSVEVKNLNGFLFPLTPKYLLFIAKGTDGINVVDHRFADASTIYTFNRIIARNKNEIIIALQKDLSKCLKNMI